MVSKSSLHEGKFGFFENFSADSDFLADLFLGLDEKILEVHHMFLDELHVVVVVFIVLSSLFSVFEDESGVLTLDDFDGGVDDLFVGFHSDKLGVLDVLDLNLGGDIVQLFFREVELAGLFLNEGLGFFFSLLGFGVSGGLFLLGDIQLFSDKLIDPLSGFEQLLGDGLVDLGEDCFFLGGVSL